MGTCLTIGENNVDPNGSEVPQMSKSLALKLKEFTPEEKDKLEHCIITLQSHLRRIRARKSLETERKKIIDKFNQQIKENPNVTKITEDELTQAINPSVQSAIDTFTSEAQTLIQNGILKDNEIINTNQTQTTIPRYTPITSFLPCPIKDNITGEIYDGNMKYNPKEEQFEKCGNSTIITNKGEVIKCNFPRSRTKPTYINANIFYTNGDVFCGSIENESPYTTPLSGTFLHKSKSPNDSSYINSQYEKAENINNNKIQNVTITYPNGNTYTGEGILSPLTNTEIVSNGEGLLKIAQDNSTYQGTFKNGKQNGKGTQFIPFDKDNYENGVGKYIISTWTNGQKNGKGVIKTKNSDESELIENCLFRFDKVIRTIHQVSQTSINLNKNILQFFNYLEIDLLFKTIKTKSLLEIKRDKTSHNKIKFALMMYNEDTYTKSKNIKTCKINNELLRKIDSIANIDYLVSTYYNQNNVNNDKFLPFFAYETNGGIVESRFHYNNIFNPERTKTYTTHYILHCNKDISIIGVINKNIFDTYSKANNIEQYKTFYTEAETKSYLPIEKYRKDINEEKHIHTNNFIGNVNNISVCIQSLNIFIPKLFDIYSLCNSPCNFLAVYLSMQKETTKLLNINIDEQLIKDVSFDLKGLYLLHSKNQIPILSFHEDQKYSYIEYDTVYNGNYSKSNCAKLLCVVQIKEFFEDDYDNVDINIKLQRFYHLGNYVNVKLICQDLLPELKKKTCIDFGTISFYGDIIEYN